MMDPARGRLVPPNLDDRTWQDLVDEARALIPKYAPQWTDHNPSDIGIALVELFAWLVEGLTFRLNRVPEKNYIAFLNLIGITRKPAVAARAFLTFSLPPQRSTPLVVPQGQQVQTQALEGTPPIVFETDAPATILPINLKSVLTGSYEFQVSIVGGLTETTARFHYTDATTRFAAPPATGGAVTVPDSILHGGVQWRNGLGVILFGFDRPTLEEIAIQAAIDAPNPPAPFNFGGYTHRGKIRWRYSKTDLDLWQWPELTTDPSFQDGTAELSKNGTVRFKVPGDWAALAPSNWTFADTPGTPVADSRYWVCAVIENMPYANFGLEGSAFDIRLNALLFNTASAHNALSIPVPEVLGQGDGTAFQVFPLAHRPLFAAQNATPYAHVRIGIERAHVLTPWTEVEEFPPGPGNHYRLDPVTGEVLFGNFDSQTGRGNGTMPTSADRIVAMSYRYVADGAAGNVGPATLTAMTRPLPGIDRILNVAAAFAGSDDEPIEETKLRAPQELRVRARAVTAEDYEYLAKEASENIALVRCLTPRYDASNNAWQFGKIDRSSGNVTVIIVPATTRAVLRPKPSDDTLLFMQAYLDRRRDLTAKLFVTSARYLPIAVIAEATLFKHAVDTGLVTAAGVRADLAARATAFLHPTLGGPEGKGWQVGASVSIADVYKAIQLADDLGFISKLSLNGETPDYHVPPNNVNSERPFPLEPPGPRVQVADYELICPGTMTITTVALS
jgi:hypothetical protein